MHGHTLTNPPLAVVNTLVVSPPSPLLSCTAPDKQHQKQHSHQPQRKHPLTCSGIYLLSPPFSCVCVCLSHRPSVLQDPYLHHTLLPYFFTFVCFSSVCLADCGWSLRSCCDGHSSRKGLKPAGGVRKHFPMVGGDAMWLALGLILGCHAIFLSVKVCQRGTDSQCLLGLSVRFTSSFLFMLL